MKQSSPNEQDIAGYALDRRLNSWKEIAAELGVGVRTAQIYEVTRGLPIQRDGHHVSIAASQLRRWQDARFGGSDGIPTRPGARRTVLAVAVASLLLVAAGSWVLFRAKSERQPVAVRWSGPTLTALAPDTSPLWRHTFSNEIMPGSDGGRPSPWIGDIDHDGQSEILTVYPSIRREEEGWDLYCFSSSGRIRWRFGVKTVVASQRRSFAPPYVLRDFAPLPSPERDGTMWVAAVFAHHVMSPGVLVVLDAAGRARGELWQDGHLNAVRAIDLNGDGIHEIVAGGIQEIPAQAVLLVVDPRSVGGVARVENEASPRQLRGLGRGTEKATIYFPRTTLNLKGEPFNYVNLLNLVGRSIQATVVERFTFLHGYLVYSLTPELRVANITVSDSLVAAARRSNLPRGTYPASRDEVEAMARRVRVVRWE